MIFKQVFDTKTSTYTYLIASAKGREAVIIDPVIENNPKIFAAIIAMIIGLLSKNVLATIFSGLISYWFLIFVVFS